MNAVADRLFRTDKEFRERIALTARVEFERRKAAFRAVSIFEVEDLEQELWAAIFEANTGSQAELAALALRKAEAIAQRGMHKTSCPETYKPFTTNERLVEVPASQLRGAEKDAIDDLLYSSDALEKPYPESMRNARKVPR